MNKIPVVIFAGGEGSRLGEITQEKIPKPMVKIGKIPIIAHIIKSWCLSGFSEFIILGGYKFEVLESYFKNSNFPEISITVVDTGIGTGTAGRLSKVKNLIGGRVFCASYGDGVTDFPLEKLLEFHNQSGGIVTMLVTHPIARFGEVEFDKYGRVTEFSEKPISDKWINAGFFVFTQDIFDFILSEDEMLEGRCFNQISSRWNLYALPIGEHFWHCMDTPKDWKLLNDMANKGESPWIGKAKES